MRGGERKEEGMEEKEEQLRASSAGAMPGKGAQAHPTSGSDVLLTMHRY